MTSPVTLSDELVEKVARAIYDAFATERAALNRTTPESDKEGASRD